MSRGNKDRPTCVTCGKAGAWTCEPCKAERRRLDRLHGRANPATLYPLAALLDREARVQAYRRRAMRKLPLFTGRD